MNPTLDDWKAKLAALPEHDRAELAHFLIHTLEIDRHADSPSSQEFPFELTDEFKAELQRRLDAHHDDPKAGEPWDVVRKGLLERERICTPSS